MRSKNNHPDAIEKKWIEAVAEHSCLVTSSPYIQIHHVLGASARRNKVRVGHWYILPIAVELHDISSNHPYNITLHKKEFEKQYGTELELFNKLIDDRILLDYWIPDIEIINAINDTI